MIKKIYTALKRESFPNFIKLVIERIITNLIAFPFAVVIVVISPFLRIRFIRLFSFRIGHYAINTELLLCAMDRNLYNEKRKIVTFFYTAPGEPICNSQLHRMWKRVITILPFPYIVNQIDKFLSIFLGDKYRNDSLKKNYESSTGGHDLG